MQRFKKIMSAETGYRDQMLAHKASLLNHLMAQCESTDAQLAAEKALTEKLLEAIEGVTHYITGYAGSDEQDALDTALAAYRKARGM